MYRPQAVPALDPLYADIRRRDIVRPALLVDVRERDEFVAMRVEGCLFIPMSQLGVRVDEIPKDRPVMVICATGNRSTTATAFLLQHGWEDVASVAGGIDGWHRLGLPVKRGPVGPGEGQLIR
jgi:rhodanese-related sulfurtransferase